MIVLKQRSYRSNALYVDMLGLLFRGKTETFIHCLHVYGRTCFSTNPWTINEVALSRMHPEWYQWTTGAKTSLVERQKNIVAVCVITLAGKQAWQGCCQPLTTALHSDSHCPVSFFFFLFVQPTRCVCKMERQTWNPASLVSNTCKPVWAWSIKYFICICELRVVQLKIRRLNHYYGEKSSEGLSQENVQFIYEVKEFSSVV